MPMYWEWPKYTKIIISKMQPNIVVIIVLGLGTSRISFCMQCSFGHCCHYNVLFLLGIVIVVFNLHPTISWHKCQQLNKPRYWLLSYYCTRQTLIEWNFKVEVNQHLNIGQSLDIQDISTNSWTLFKESNICSNQIGLNPNVQPNAVEWNWKYISLNSSFELNT